MIMGTPVEAPVPRGDPESIVDSVRPVTGGEALTVETAGIGIPEDVTLIPCFRLHHERNTLSWKVAAKG